MSDLGQPREGFKTGKKRGVVERALQSRSIGKEVQRESLKEQLCVQGGPGDRRSPKEKGAGRGEESRR